MTKWDAGTAGTANAIKPDSMNARADESAAEDLFEMANLSPKRTGLPFVVWISPRGGAQYDVRVKVTRGPKAVPGEFISVTVRPEVTLIGPGKLSTQELELLRQWIELNRDVLIRFWNGDIEYTEDAIAEIQPLRT